jgi:spore coat polysaccharide biosynthesis protein SpsF (cytidylyltransferase family)
MMPCFILARANSERLPGKHFLPLGDVCVIEHMVLRCQHFGFMPYLCVPRGEYDVFNEQTSCLDIFEGDPDNVETRVLECATKYNIRLFHSLDGDDPFFDPYAVLDSFNAARQARLSQVTPSYNSQSGTGRMGTTFNLDAPAGGVRNLMDAAPHVYPQRLTLDYPEDYALIAMIARTLGYMAPRSAVDELFVKNPDLYQINWFRNAEWKERQADEQRRNRIREAISLDGGE